MLKAEQRMPELRMALAGHFNLENKVKSSPQIPCFYAG